MGFKPNLFMYANYSYAVMNNNNNNEYRYTAHVKNRID